MATGYIYDPRFLDHDTRHGHPESPARLTAIMAELEASPSFGDLVALEASPADKQWIETVHAGDYIARAQATIEGGAPYLDSMDVAVGMDSYAVAMLAAGAGLALGDAVMQGRIANGMGIVRPPGHHAEHDQALGFCVFNNIAILARYLQQAHGIGRVAIMDWDVHHGNGTQHTFEDDPSVLYISTHQFPYYPGTGSSDERGTGAGVGSVLNCPLPAGAGRVEYEAAFIKKVLPCLHEFGPEVLLISAGFDAHADDPLADMRLPTEFFGQMTEWMLDVAAEHCGGRLISLLEGGYNLRRTGECVALHLETLAGAAPA